MQPGTVIRDTRYEGPYERDRVTGNSAGIDGYTEHRLTFAPGVIMTLRESTTGFAEPAFHYVHTDRLGSGIKGTEVINSKTGVRVQFLRPEGLGAGQSQEKVRAPWGQVLF